MTPTGWTCPRTRRSASTTCRSASSRRVTSSRGSVSRSATGCSTWPRSPRSRAGRCSRLRSADLNAFLALGRPSWRAVRAWLTELLTHPARPRSSSRTSSPPADVADAAAGRGRGLRRLLRQRAARRPTSAGSSGPDAEPLTPNWRHLPIGYHGRSGTVVVSGTDIVRPAGQRRPRRRRGAGLRPQHPAGHRGRGGLHRRRTNGLGDRVASRTSPSTSSASCLLNDWSARDIQAWEYVPLGPFLGKSFATSLSRLGGAVGCPGRGPGPAARPGSRAAALPARRDPESAFGLDLDSRSGSTARWCPGRPTPRRTGRRRRCSRT